MSVSRVNKLRKLRKHLLKIARDYNCPVIFQQPEHFLFFRYNNKSKNANHHYSGEFLPTEIKIYVNKHNDKAPEWAQVFVLAHEVRHLIHMKEGLFSDYYDLQHYTDDIPYEYELPCLHTAFLAEMDCNNYAAKMFKEFKIGLPKQPTYDYKQTAAYRRHEQFKFGGYYEQSYLRTLSRTM